jgi:cellulose synthase/poly-beta-1,6-N-acetylglucosamine synthase-like glycosyltransferase
VSARPRATVIVVYHDARRWFGDALASAAVQDSPPGSYEIVVVNDRCAERRLDSVRATWAAVTAGMHRRPRLRYIEIGDGCAGGLSAAVNAGLSTALGRYCTVLPDDDLIYAHKLRVLGDALDADPSAACVYSRPKWIDGDGAAIEHPAAVDRFFARHPTVTWADIERRSGLFVHGTSTMYRTAIARALGGWDESLDTAEEWEFHLRMLRAGHTMISVDSVTTAYRRHPGGKSRRFAGRRDDQMRRIYAKMRAMPGEPTTIGERR